MATSVIFDLITALVTQADAALSAVTVYDGFGISEDPGDFLMIGVEDPDLQDAETSAESRQSWAGLGARARDEEGTITCAALSWNGNADQAAARASVKATCAAVENLLRTSPTLGVSGVLWTGYGTRTQLLQDQNDGGALAICVFDVQFRARI